MTRVVARPDNESIYFGELSPDAHPAQIDLRLIRVKRMSWKGIEAPSITEFLGMGMLGILFSHWDCEEVGNIELPSTTPFLIV